MIIQTSRPRFGGRRGMSFDRPGGRQLAQAGPDVPRIPQRLFMYIA
jgi:hypothetical protein